MGLDQQARNWPTPQTKDYRSGITGNIKKKNSRPLCEVACQHSLPAPTRSTNGEISLKSTRRLNPRFVAHLMGLDPAWTSLERLETASFHSWLRMHSEALRRLRSAHENWRKPTNDGTEKRRQMKTKTAAA
jgi:hypothetical protein